MNIISLLTKKKLENIIKYSFLNFKQYKSYIFLDLLKCYGFFYATDSGISISIEDLKVSLKTSNHLNNLNNEILNKTYNWSKGLLSEKDRFDFIINSWAEITEDIKNDIVHYFETFDPLNSLFIMASSGARGNMSQVRQLIGVRGLMSDQEGNIINVPVNACFRNGLSPVDYIISAYGARKGVVDTAVKTAAAGYLTRRLIFLARNILIKQIDCKSKNGILINLSKTNDKVLYGYTLLDIYKKDKKIEINFNDLIPFKDKIINYELLSLFRSKKNYQNLLLKIRSILTCNISNSLCQKCYGFDSSTDQLVKLGELVGIIAAQSIGEPGTQLTMRTFHTGGVFSVQKITELKSSFIGKIFLNKDFSLIKNILPSYFLEKKEFKKNKNFRSIKATSKVILYNCKEGYFKKLILNSGFLPTFKFSSYIYNLDTFEQKFYVDLPVKNKKLQPLIVTKDYKILVNSLDMRRVESGSKNDIIKTFQRNGYKSFQVNSIYKSLRTLREGFFYNVREGLLMLASGEIFNFTSNYKIYFHKNICPIKKLAFSTLSSINNGIYLLKNQRLVLLNPKIKKVFDIKNFSNFFTLNKKSQIVLILHFEKCKFFDDNSNLLSFIALPNCYKKSTFCRRVKDENAIFVFNLCTSLIQNFQNDKNYIFNKKKFLHNSRVNSITKKYRKNNFKSNKHIVKKKNGLKYSYLKRFFILFPKNLLLTTQFLREYISKNSLIAYFVTQVIQGNDIVQGIPSVHQIIEAHKPQYSAVISYQPGYHIDSISTKEKIYLYINDKNSFKIKKFNFDFKGEYSLMPKKNYSSSIFDQTVFIFNNVKLPLIFAKKKIFICEKIEKSISQEILSKFDDFSLQELEDEKKKIEEKKEVDFIKFPICFNEPVNYDIENLIMSIDKEMNYMISKEDYEKDDEYIKNSFDRRVYRKNYRELIDNLKRELKNLINKLNRDDKNYIQDILDNNFEVLYDVCNIKILISNLKYKKSYMPIFSSSSFPSSNVCSFNCENFLKIDTPLDLYKFLKNTTKFEIFFRSALICIKHCFNYIEGLKIFYLYFGKGITVYKEKIINSMLLGSRCKKDILKDKKSMTSFLENLEDDVQTNNLRYTINYVEDFIRNCVERKYIDMLTQFLYESIYYLTNFDQESILFLKQYAIYSAYFIKGPAISQLYKRGKFVNVGEPVSNGSINPHELLQALYIYNIQHYKELNISSSYSINKFRLILLNSILSVYQGQEVKILLKHIEIICKQLTSYVIYVNKINEVNYLFPGEETNSQVANVEHITYLSKTRNIGIKMVKIRYLPKFVSIRKAITEYAFLSSASFQDVKFVLTRGALLGFRDFCSGLKERVICGKPINAGTSLEYKKENILNSKHFYKFK